MENGLPRLFDVFVRRGTDLSARNENGGSLLHSAAGGDLYLGSSGGGGYGQNDVYVSRFSDGAYGEPENLGPAVNTAAPEFSPYVAPDQSYLLLTRVLEDGDTDIFVTFPNDDGEWSPAQNVGAPVNSPGGELCPVVSPDGHYLFFLGRRDGIRGVYWTRADVIDTLKPR